MENTQAQPLLATRDKTRSTAAALLLSRPLRTREATDQDSVNVQRSNRRVRAIARPQLGARTRRAPKKIAKQTTRKHAKPSQGNNADRDLTGRPGGLVKQQQVGPSDQLNANRNANPRTPSKPDPKCKQQRETNRCVVCANLVGSSKSRRLGPVTSSTPIATRRRSPPEMPPLDQQQNTDAQTSMNKRIKLQGQHGSRSRPNTGRLGSATVSSPARARTTQGNASMDQCQS